MRHPEYQYLDLMETIMSSGDERLDRTGVGTRSIFGAMMRFDLSAGVIPLLTTKRVYWKLAAKELLWFLSGDTNIRGLLKQGVRIWTAWPLAAYRKATGQQISQEEFEYRIIEDAAFAASWGSIGPGYGKQWRRWQGPDGREHDQIDTLVRTLRENPASRRMLFHGWNVSDIDKMSLPPCHLLYQYHVTSSGRLNGLLFARSQDLFLGTPFNIAEAAMLLNMLAQQSDLTPGELIWFSGDTHLYLNHLDQARRQISLDPRPFPTLRLKRRPPTIDDYSLDDFVVDGYDPHPPISAPVAV